jgi:hypothetical protein
MTGYGFGLGWDSAFGLTAYSMVELVGCAGPGLDAMTACLAVNISNARVSYTSPAVLSAKAYPFVGSPIPYGTGHSCMGGGVSAYASVNLTGTPFTMNEAFLFGAWAGTFSTNGCVVTSQTSVTGEAYVPVACDALMMENAGSCSAEAPSSIAVPAPSPYTGYINSAYLRLGQTLLLLTPLPPPPLSPSPSPSPLTSFLPSPFPSASPSPSPSPSLIE